MYDKTYQQKYRQLNKTRLRLRDSEYRQRIAVKIRTKLYNRTCERKEKQAIREKIRRQIPEVKKRNLIHQIKYLTTKKGKDKINIRQEEYINKTKKISILTSPKWILYFWSKLIKRRDSYKCQVCNAIAQNAHHIFPKAKYPGFSLNLNNGISLCYIHHKEIHDLNGWIK